MATEFEKHLGALGDLYFKATASVRELEQQLKLEQESSSKFAWQVEELKETIKAVRAGEAPGLRRALAILDSLNIEQKNEVKARIMEALIIAEATDQGGNDE